jgi:GTPase
VVAVTKSDLDPEQANASAETLAAYIGSEVHVISAEQGEGTDALTSLLMGLVRQERERAAQEREEEIPVLRPESSERFTITPDGDGRYVVEGRRVVTFVEMMDLEMDGAREEIERRLDRWGVTRALRKAGAVSGDTLVFGEVELKFEDV